MQLTLLYHPGKTFYSLVLRPLMANCTSRINHKVTKSPTVVLTWSTPIREPSHSPSENIHLRSPTITHSQYLRQNIDFKRKSTLVIMTRVDLCLKSMFCRRYCECVIVGEPKWMFSLTEGGGPLLAWTLVSTTIGDFVTLR